MAGDANPQTFSFETVAVLVAIVDKSGIKLGPKNYEEMARLDGKRTASSFDHGFRKVKARARELAGHATAAANGGTSTPGSNTKPGATEKVTKKGNGGDGKRKGKSDVFDDDEDDDEESPMKKTKVKAELTEETDYLAEVNGEDFKDAEAAFTD